MRLLNTHTLQLQTFLGPVPQYAILSHTWGEEEITFEDMKAGGNAQNMKGYRKLEESAKVARDDGFDFIWIDTCCIDKSSSAELSEAINSMFQWYKQAVVCYAYLADVDCDTEITSKSAPDSFEDSRWFTRGWTLQELIAPEDVIFLGSSWKRMGTKESLSEIISRMTNIPTSTLKGWALDETSAAARMSWASNRVTTRPEDRAYSLLGLFDVNMPLLYGEGEEKAFTRLQHEFLKFSEDETIFAWRADPDQSRSKPYWGLLAPSPSCFRDSQLCERSGATFHLDIHPTVITNRGIHIELPLVPMPGDGSQSVFLGFLQCVEVGRLVTIVLQRLSGLEKQYTRIAPDVLVTTVFRQSIAVIPKRRLTATFLLENMANACPPHNDRDFKTLLNDVSSKSQLIFIRPSPGESQPVTGFYFYPQARLSTQVEGTFAVRAERDHMSVWRVDKTTGMGPKAFFTITNRGGGFLHADRYHYQKFNEFRLGDPRHRWISGTFLLHISFAPEDGSSKKAWTRSTAVAVGFAPLPPNPFGTPPAYVQPWFGFYRNIDAGLGRGIFGNGPDQDVDLRFSQCVELPDSLHLTAGFTVTSRLNGIFYELNLRMEKSSQS
ncbi:heterokaryon incompatibility protein-domain-containing protein [Cercophora scortea]|uniref:Heterokaryon incompatibility protein-domain-containing protein n=1 Tax=Cercophora scortea TaxID=314031 RepID=A0AAE0IXA8_9PEZI|nr:heterokaryon incompatibility protein-domain-containing protein [Cercophora scortea]